jgi:hypothetical protein
MLFSGIGSLGYTCYLHGGVVVLSAVIVLSGADQPRAQLVLTADLPVIGTWVGTVLAYYFSKENLETATRSVAATASQMSPDESCDQSLSTQ